MELNRQLIQYSLAGVGGEVSIFHRSLDILMPKNSHYNYQGNPSRYKSRSGSMSPSMKASLFYRRVKGGKKSAELFSQRFVKCSPFWSIGKNQVIGGFAIAKSMHYWQKFISYFNLIRSLCLRLCRRVKNYVSLKANILDFQFRSFSDPRPGPIEKLPEVSTVRRCGIEYSDNFIRGEESDMRFNFFGKICGLERIACHPSHFDTEINPGNQNSDLVADSIGVIYFRTSGDKRLNYFGCNIFKRPVVGKFSTNKRKEMIENHMISYVGIFCIARLDRIYPLFSGGSDRSDVIIFPTEVSTCEADFYLLQIGFSKFLLLKRNFRGSLDSPAVGKVVRDMPSTVSGVNGSHNNHRPNFYTESVKKHLNRLKWLRFSDIFEIRSGNFEQNFLFP